MERARLTAITVWSLLSLVDSEALTISVSERLINAAVGDPVLLSVRPSEKVRSGSWKHNGSDVLVWINTTANINNVYLGRVEFLQSNSSLLLKSATASDNGEYCVTMNSFGDAVVNTTIILSVFEPISSVSIISNISNTVKENDTVSLRCHVLGDWTEIVWLFNGSLVNSKGKTTFCSGNAMLMIIHVDTSNIGNYRCIVRSPVSEKASEPYSLKLNMTTTQSDSYSSHEWKAAVVVLAVISITELMGIAVLLFKVRKMSHSETQRYILPTVSGTISAPTYENFLPSVNDEKECGNQDQSNSNYTDLQISNISVYEQLERETRIECSIPKGALHIFGYMDEMKQGTADIGNLKQTKTEIARGTQQVLQHLRRQSRVNTTSPQGHRFKKALAICQARRNALRMCKALSGCKYFLGHLLTS
ncbi:carcinoembryonic antigen-related cell adhesion molecule 1-like isoform X2 [Chiloscyllium plagiosum]|uniref:carcinoembryonic antigen-related cell adhesion molecule 1-like isoform X2 n=1 Tax=Chiloscyllium plagiosum TaxID=36176 RepID=UPI001CB7F452|nr:carcinoembryonic antigen-related cell adhesion molecule 1-like isoform X2 [Chiloscyllium plagiosum]